MIMRKTFRSVGLDKMIDRPRIYRQEQLPRSLPWTTIQAFLGSINRDSAIGKRDFGMFSLMTTYGVRACDVVALTLDDIHWRAGLIRIRQSKTGKPLDLPLTDEVGSAIQDYLKRVPRNGVYRQVFLRIKAPGGALKPTAVIMGTCVPFLPPAADQVPRGGGESRVGGLLRLLARESEIELGERSPGYRRAGRGRGRREEPGRLAAQQEQPVRRFGWQACRTGAAEQRD